MAPEAASRLTSGEVSCVLRDSTLRILASATRHWSLNGPVQLSGHSSGARWGGGRGGNVLKGPVSLNSDGWLRQGRRLQRAFGTTTSAARGKTLVRQGTYSSNRGGH